MHIFFIALYKFDGSFFDSWDRFKDELVLDWDSLEGLEIIFIFLGGSEWGEREQHDDHDQRQVRGGAAQPPDPPVNLRHGGGAGRLQSHPGQED